MGSDALLVQMVMHMRNFRTLTVALFAMALASSATPALAQVDLSGSWMARQHEDRQERQPGPDAGDYLGLPINEEGRVRALTYNASQIALPERQCYIYTPIYLLQGPFALKIWTDIHPLTGEIIAYKINSVVDRAGVTIWMDGRPHPDENDLHTLAGFTTGHWEGTTLVTRTTHFKEGYLRRNGVPTSDEATITMYFTRHGDYLSVTAFMDDPIYLSETFVASRTWQLDNNAIVSPVSRPCWVTDVEITALDDPNLVPHYLPGKNPFVDEMTKRYNLPVETVLGGAETMYPEYRKRLKDTYKAPDKCRRYCDGQNQRPTP